MVQAPWRWPHELPTVLSPLLFIPRAVASRRRRVVAALRAEPLLLTSVGDAAQLLEQVGAGKLHVVAVLPRGLGEHVSRTLFGAAPKPEIERDHDPSQASVLAAPRDALTKMSAAVGEAAASAGCPRPMRRVRSRPFGPPPTRRRPLTTAARTCLPACACWARPGHPRDAADGHAARRLGAGLHGGRGLALPLASVISGWSPPSARSAAPCASRPRPASPPTPARDGPGRSASRAAPRR
jgi:hypothetical protein